MMAVKKEKYPFRRVFGDFSGTVGFSFTFLRCQVVVKANLDLVPYIKRYFFYFLSLQHNN